MKTIGRTTKIVGVLGGMGPYATVTFMEHVLQMTPAEKDWEHLRLVVDSNPHIPSRTRHLLFDEPSPVPGMVDSCARLASYPVDLIAIPCNSACAFVDEIRSQSEARIVDIVEVTANALADDHGEVRSCAVVGGRVTYAKRSYDEFLAAQGISYIHHDESLQCEIESLIERIKLLDTGLTVVEECEAVISRLCEEYAAEAVILGCTEFGCIETRQFDVPVLDSSRQLAAFIVKEALGNA